MIHFVSFKNFYSFKNDTFIDFCVNKNALKSDSCFVSPKNTKLSKILSIVGPNASGKTNLLKVLPFLSYLIVDSFNEKPLDDIPVKSFLFGKSKKNPIEMSVIFELDTGVYNYFISMNEKTILKEKLTIRSKTKKKTTEKLLFIREWNSVRKNWSFIEKIGLPSDFERSLRSNATIISTAVRFNNKISQEIYFYWKNLETNVREHGYSNPVLRSALLFFEENSNIKQEAIKLLNRFDLGLEDLIPVKDDNDKKSQVKEILAHHTFEGKKYLLPIDYESSGTKQLIIILRSILQVLSTGGIAVIDEFDSNLHPDMVIPIIKLFTSTNTNKYNAQLIFSTHNHRILGDLEKYQIQLVEKNKGGYSQSWRLDEMKNVRADDNYYTKYITGAYGAIPNIE